MTATAIKERAPKTVENFMVIGGGFRLIFLGTLGQ